MKKPTYWFVVVQVALLACFVCAGVCADEQAGRVVLPNGLVVIVKPSATSDLVAVEVLLKVSVLEEGAQRGIRHLLAQMALEGQSQAIEELGGRVGAEAALDCVEFHAVTTSDGFETALGALAAMAQRHDFPSARLEIVRKEHLEYLKTLKEDPFQSTYLLLRQGLYRDHPYALAAAGQPEVVESLGREELQAFHSRWFVPNNAAVVVCGNVGAPRALQAVKKAFGEWEPRALPEKTSLPVKPLEDSTVLAEEAPAVNAHLMVGFLAPSAAEQEEFAAFQVINSLLGRGMSGRVMRRLRGGLAYEITSFLQETGHFGIYVACRPEQIEEVKAAIAEEIKRLLSEPVGKEELEMAKKYLLGQQALSRQRVLNRASQLAWYEVLGRNASSEENETARIQSVTPEALQQTARKYLTRMVIALRLPE